MFRSLPVFLVAAACAAELPPAAVAPVDFVRDVQPIFAEHCLSCHGPDKQKFMKTKHHRLRSLLTAVAAAAALLLDADVQAQSADPFPATYVDPAVPLLQLPTSFRAGRTLAVPLRRGVAAPR